jgi:polar amino acid transport system substrate-binding protein
LQSESFGVVLGVNYGDKFELFTKKNQPKTASYYDGMANMRGMLTGLHSITVSNVLGATTILKSMNKESQVKMLEPVLQDVASYLAFSKVAKLTNVRDKFDKTLKQMKADGTYKKIISKYL